MSAPCKTCGKMPCYDHERQTAPKASGPLCGERDSPKRETAIVRDDEHCFGAWRLDGTRIPVSALLDRFKAGECVDSIAADLGIWTCDVESAVRWVIKNPKRYREAQ